MLGAPRTKTLAYFGKVGDFAGTDSLIDNNTQVEVEIWKYNPTLLVEALNVDLTYSYIKIFNDIV